MLLDYTSIVYLAIAKSLGNIWLVELIKNLRYVGKYMIYLWQLSEQKLENNYSYSIFIY